MVSQSRICEPLSSVGQFFLTVAVEIKKSLSGNKYIKIQFNRYMYFIEYTFLKVGYAMRINNSEKWYLLYIFFLRTYGTLK